MVVEQEGVGQEKELVVFVALCKVEFRFPMVTATDKVEDKSG